MKFSLTLNQVFLLSVLSLAVLLGALFFVLQEGSRRSLLDSSQQIRLQVGQRVLDQVSQFRDVAEGVVSDIQNQIRSGLVRIDRPKTLEAALYAEVLNHPNTAEATFTHADGSKFDGNGDLILGPTDRWQISVYRTSLNEGPASIIARQVMGMNKKFIASLTPLRSAADISSPPPATQPATDPTAHPTFAVSVMTGNVDQFLWSDLHWSELDPSRRVEVTVQKSLFDPRGNLIGVVRVGLLAGQLDTIVAQGQASDSRCFLCDDQGRLVTRLSPTDRIAVSGDDLRVSPASLPPEIAQALRLPAVSQADTQPATGGTITQDGRQFLVTFLPVPRTQGWILGVVAPEEHYLGGLRSMQRQLMLWSVLVMALILAGGILTLRAIHRGLSRVMGITGKMKLFDFSPSPVRAPFRDLQDVIQSIEQSKTAMRAMGKYVPVDLVRDLFQMNREPTLGGQMMDISIMFTDIRGFTELTEQMSPDRLAAALGHYLQTISGAIITHRGTIDKYIGDSVMVLWSAPRPVPNDAAEACASALACVAAARQLYQSPDWQGLPPWFTRYGLHRDRVRVGHFGSPTRMNYTALGDGVNLASRLEGLNEVYGTTIIVSQAMRDAAGGEFSFRLLDRVAVKGKKQAVNIYELLDEQFALHRGAVIASYEAALKAYWSRDFPQAQNLLKPNADDAPSQVLAQRCEIFIAAPPPPDWTGVYTPASK